LNPTIGAWGNVLKQHGPLSITVDADPGKGYIHALVVIGFDGDGTAKNTIVSYIDPDGGKKRDVKFEDFLKLYEGSARWPLQIIHNP
jgi:Papain-like cysteine protease AvrRpt2